LGRGVWRENVLQEEQRVERGLRGTEPRAGVLERAIFHHVPGNVYLIADAYRGREIKSAVNDFFEAAAGLRKEATTRVKGLGGKEIEVAYAPSLAVYVGHGGLMDFPLERQFTGADTGKREAMIFACASKAFFAAGLRPTGARPLLWTAGLMAPEAYTLKAALDGWIVGESPEQVRRRAAGAYAKYQKISLRAAQRLFTSSW
jgi:hypothetical protein